MREISLGLGLKKSGVGSYLYREERVIALITPIATLPLT
jgi:hypothetical protein